MEWGPESAERLREAFDTLCCARKRHELSDGRNKMPDLSLGLSMVGKLFACIRPGHTQRQLAAALRDKFPTSPIGITDQNVGNWIQGKNLAAKNRTFFENVMREALLLVVFGNGEQESTCDEARIYADAIVTFIQGDDGARGNTDVMLPFHDEKFSDTPTPTRFIELPTFYKRAERHMTGSRARKAFIVNIAGSTPFNGGTKKSVLRLIQNQITACARAGVIAYYVFPEVNPEAESRSSCYKFMDWVRHHAPDVLPNVRAWPLQVDTCRGGRYAWEYFGSLWRLSAVVTSHGDHPKTWEIDACGIRPAWGDVCLHQSFTPMPSEKDKLLDWVRKFVIEADRSEPWNCASAGS